MSHVVQSGLQLSNVAEDGLELLNLLPLPFKWRYYRPESPNPILGLVFKQGKKVPTQEHKSLMTPASCKQKEVST